MSGWKKRLMDWLPPVVLLLLLAVVWEGYGRVVPAYVFPSLTETWDGLLSLLHDAEFLRAVATSLQSLIIGFLLSVAAGVFLGACMGWYASFGEFADVYLSIGLAIPMSAAVPVVVGGLGIGLASRVAVVFLFAVFIITLNTYTGIRQTNPDLLEMGRSFGARRWQEFRRIIWPSALPAVVTGVRLGAGRAVVGMVVLELLLVSVGLGKLVVEYKATMEIGKMMALLLVMLVGGALLVRAIEVIERCLFPWRREAS